MEVTHLVLKHVWRRKNVHQKHRDHAAVLDPARSIQVSRPKSTQQIHEAHHIVKVAAVQNQVLIGAVQGDTAVQSLDPIAAAGLALALALWIITDDHAVGLMTDITIGPSTKVAILEAEAHIIVQDSKILRIHVEEITTYQGEGCVEGIYLAIVTIYLVWEVVEGHDISIISLAILGTIVDLIEACLDQTMTTAAQWGKWMLQKRE